MRVDAPSDSEQMALLTTAYPQLLPLLPAAVGTLCLVQAAGGHHDGHPQQHGAAGAAQQADGGGASGTGTAGIMLTAAGVQQHGRGSGGAAAAAAVQRGPWHGLAEAALAAAGLRRGDLALHLGRHFSLRDVFKWCARMMVGGAGMMG